MMLSPGIGGSYDFDHLTRGGCACASSAKLGETSMSAMDCLPAGVQAAGVERVLSPGQALFRLGDRTKGIYGIVKGQVQMVRVDAGGREVVLFAAGPGDVFAEAALFAPTYHCDAMTKTGAVVRLF